MRLSDWAVSRRPTLYWFVIIVVALGALTVRAPRLRLRPMHTDEAVHADKFRILLETGLYRYDPHEYHGPSLNYLTLIPAWLRSEHTYAQIDETTLRLVPVAAGVLLVLLTALLRDGLGPAGFIAALLAAISPAFVFYSRYYIQEMLLVSFTFAVIVCGYRYIRTGAKRWIVAAGASVGLMHATKETCIIALGAMIVALGFVFLIRMWKGWPLRSAVGAVKGRHLLLGLFVAVGVSAALYSCFLRYPQGIVDSYLTYGTYFGRAGGQSTVHVHPWYYYLQMLLLSRCGDGPIWTEGLILGLALVGSVTAVRGGQILGVDSNLLKFLAIYTVAMTVAYCAIPYKTPWCALGFLHGMILLAGVGVVTIVACVRKPALRTLALVLLAVGIAHLAFQAYRGSFVYYSDSRNPYVYAHPTDEVFTAVRKVEACAAASGEGYQMPIQVACTGDDYWPLPWYLRAFKQVGWYSKLPDRIGPLILISGDLENDLAQTLYVKTPVSDRRMYMSLFDDPYFIWFRPGVKMLGFVRKDLWDQAHRRPTVEGQR
jgi:uncharacterized protein (TIGR03663 family)